MNIVSALSFTNKHAHLVYYWRPDASVHMVTTNGRFYTHGTHNMRNLDGQGISREIFSDREFLNREN